MQSGVPVQLKLRANLFSAHAPGFVDAPSDRPWTPLAQRHGTRTLARTRGQARRGNLLHPHPHPQEGWQRDQPLPRRRRGHLVRTVSSKALLSVGPLLMHSLSDTDDETHLLLRLTVGFLAFVVSSRDESNDVSWDPTPSLNIP